MLPSVMATRWTFFWDSSIEAGVVFAATLPWLALPFTLHVRNWRAAWYLVSTCAGGAGAVAVALTGSRGPILGAFVGLCALALTQKRLMGSWTRARVLFLAWVAAALAGALVLLPVRARLDLQFLQHDGSLANRWELWKAATDMLFLRPLAGIGWGESGHFYSQWYQPDHIQYLYTGMLNSWLEIGVEFGLPAAAGLLLLASWLLTAPLMHRAGASSKGGRIGGMAYCAHGSLVVLLICSLSSSTHESPTILVLTAAGVLGTGVFIARAGSALHHRQAGLIGLSIALAFVAGAQLFRSFPRDTTLRVALRADDGIEISKATSRGQSREAAVVLSDRQVLGPVHGQHLRAVLRTSSAFERFVVYDPRRPWPSGWPEGIATAVAFGSSVNVLEHADPQRWRRVFIIHPTGARVLFPKAEQVVWWLPEYNLSPDFEWRVEGAPAGCVVHHSQSQGGAWTIAALRDTEELLQ